MMNMFSLLSYTGGTFLFSLMCVVGSSLFALGAHFRGAPCMLPLMLFGRLLFGSASQSLAGTMTSQDLDTSRIKISINYSPFQLCRIASQPAGLRTKSLAWLLAWLLVSVAWDRSWTLSSLRHFKKNMDCNGHSGVVGPAGSWMAQSCKSTKHDLCHALSPVLSRCPAVCVWIYNRHDSQHLGQC